MHTRSRRGGVVIGTLTLGALAIAVVPGHAQEAAPPDAPLTMEQLQIALRDRDALISQLLRRVEDLESRLGVAREQQVGPQAEGAAETHDEQRSLPPTQPPPPGEEPPDTVAGSTPGEFEVDEEAVERALERTLVRTGALLLPAGRAEIEPSFSYTRRVTDFPTFVVADGTATPGVTEVRRNEFDLSLGLRVGLPFDSQVEFALPYTVVDEDRVIRRGGAPLSALDQTGAGFHDFALGFAKSLLHEGQWWPDVVARVTWDSAAGRNVDDGVALGGGFHEILGQLSVTKRQDPLAFVASAGYRYSFEDDDLKPGDELLIGAGVLLAASPDTSLRLVLSQQLSDEAKFEGRSLPGTDQVASTLSLGGSSILGNGVFLDATVSVGLTDDAPDYAFAVSLPIRFGLPLD